MNAQSSFLVSPLSAYEITPSIGVLKFDSNVGPRKAVSKKPHNLTGIRSSHPEVFLKKGILKILSKFTGEHPC